MSALFNIKDLQERVTDLSDLLVSEKAYKMEKRRINGSLILVMLVSVMSLIIIEALIVISSLNINIIRSQIEYNQNCLTAQSATAQFLYEVDGFQSSNAVDICSTSMNMDFKTRFSCYPVFNEKKPYMQNDIKITFDKTKNYYSTDNFNSETPAQGWKDRNNNSASVPPFSIDLIITGRAGGSRQYFQAIICRKWPYAVFCQKGSVVVTALKTTEGEGSYIQPSQITGDILSCFMIFLGLPQTGDIDNKVTGNICTTMRKNSNASTLFDQDPLYVKSGNILTGRKKYYFNQNEKNMCYSFFNNINYPCKDEFIEINNNDYPQLFKFGNALLYHLT